MPRYTFNHPTSRSAAVQHAHYSCDLLDGGPAKLGPEGEFRRTNDRHLLLVDTDHHWLKGSIDLCEKKEHVTRVVLCAVPSVLKRSTTYDEGRRYSISCHSFRPPAGHNVSVTVTLQHNVACVEVLGGNEGLKGTKRQFGISKEVERHHKRPQTTLTLVPLQEIARNCS